jgi:hypothetical protein
MEQAELFETAPKFPSGFRYLPELTRAQRSGGWSIASNGLSSSRSSFTGFLGGSSHSLPMAARWKWWMKRWRFDATWCRRSAELPAATSLLDAPPPRA